VVGRLLYNPGLPFSELLDGPEGNKQGEKCKLVAGAEVATWVSKSTEDKLETMGRAAEVNA